MMLAASLPELPVLGKPGADQLIHWKVACAGRNSRRTLRRMLFPAILASWLNWNNTMLSISSNVSIPDDEIELSAVRSQGAGGQNVNKVSSAIHLRFDIRASSLPDFYKERLLLLRDRRINKEGVIVIKAQQYRTREKNREAALERLRQLIRAVAVVQKTRRPTKPTRGSQKRRVDSKVKRGRIKSLRGKIRD